jgi:hypothetical protein
MALSGPQKTVVQTVGVVVLMGSLAWAAVPFYDWFCRVTGFGGTTGVAEAAPDDILDRKVTVRFDASKAKDMAWEFKPVEREMEVRIGETGLAFYEAYNPTDRPIAGQASYNVAPYRQVAISRKSPASALKSRFCNPVSGLRCRSASLLIRKWSKTSKRNMCIRLLCRIHSTKLTCPRAMPPLKRRKTQTRTNAFR